MQDNITKLSPEEVEKMVTIAAKMRDGLFEDHPNYGAMLDSPAESLEESLEWMKTALVSLHGNCSQNVTICSLLTMWVMICDCGRT